MVKYKVVWDIAGFTGTKKFLLEAAREEYLKVYNDFAEKSEDFYKVLNAEYNQRFGPFEEGYTYNNPHYHGFIGARIEQALAYKGCLLEFKTTNECQIVGYLAMDPKSQISFHLQPV